MTFADGLANARQVRLVCIAVLQVPAIPSASFLK
jgi:hypothetical protein